MFPRVIPCLLLRNKGFIKTTRFKDPVYLGDPLNILKIFNEKEVDEIILLDVDATPQNREPQFNYLSQLARECFMPLGYGGGVRTPQAAERIFKSGFEKIVLNAAAHDNPSLISEIAKSFGSQSVVVAMDVKKGLWGGYGLTTHSSSKKRSGDPVEWALQAESLGAGEILVNSVDRDGCMNGYDLELMKRITKAVSVPVVACGGAGNLDHIAAVIQQAGVSAAAAGSFFVFRGPRKAVLINAPTYNEIKERLTPKVGKPDPALP